MKYCLKSLIICTILSKVVSDAALSIKIVSAPNISGTSVSTVVPPCATIKSDVNGLSQAVADQLTLIQKHGMRAAVHRMMLHQYENQGEKA